MKNMTAANTNVAMIAVTSDNAWMFIWLLGYFVYLRVIRYSSSGGERYSSPSFIP